MIFEQNIIILPIFFNSQKLEFDVNNLKISEIEKLKSNLLQIKGISSIQTTVDQTDNKIIVDTNLPSAVVQKEIERETNGIAVLRGIGTSNELSEKYRQTAAVSIISNFNELSKPIRGVVRFVQLDDSYCAVDGTIDGLKPGYHAINVCEYGDISQGCERFISIKKAINYIKFSFLLVLETIIILTIKNMVYQTMKNE